MLYLTKEGSERLFNVLPEKKKICVAHHSTKVRGEELLLSSCAGKEMR